jgi:hypothetical protein
MGPVAEPMHCVAFLSTGLGRGHGQQNRSVLQALQPMPEGRDLDVVTRAQFPVLPSGHQPHAAVEDVQGGGARWFVLGQLHAAPERQQRLLEWGARARNQRQCRPTGGCDGRLLQQLGGRGGKVADPGIRSLCAVVSLVIGGSISDDTSIRCDWRRAERYRGGRSNAAASLGAPSGT